MNAGASFLRVARIPLRASRNQTSCPRRRHTSRDPAENAWEYDLHKTNSVERELDDPAVILVLYNVLLVHLHAQETGGGVVNILDWIKLLSTGGIGTLIGGAFGVLGKAFWVRWIEERTLPTAELINRLESGKLTAYGNSRLQDEGREMLVLWRRARPVPPEGAKLSDWPAMTSAVQIRPTTYGESGSPCPKVIGDDWPLFFSLEKDTPADLGIELQAEFDVLEKQFHLSRALVSRVHFPNDRPPRVWISCLNVIVRAKRDLESVSQRLSSEVHKAIPSALVIVEVYAPSRLSPFAAGGIAMPQRDTAMIPTRPAARYAYLSDEAERLLLRGARFGELAFTDKVVPPEVLEGRLAGPLRAAIQDPSSWKTIAVSGPPGSGKTELASLVVRELIAAGQFIVIIVATPGLLESIRSLSEQVTLDDSLQVLVKGMCRDAQFMLPSTLRKTDDWEMPVADAILSVLRERADQVLLVIDDIHVHSEVAAAIARLRAHSTPFRFLLISRSGVRNASGEPFLSYDCKLWPRQSAEDMLRTWVSDSNRAQVNHVLQDGWPKKQIEFSLYLLRAMAEYIDSLESAPSELLNKAIRGHLAPIAAMLMSRQEPAAIALERIKQMVANPDTSRDDILRAITERAEIEPATVMGILAWYTIFAPPEPGSERTQRAFLDADRVVQFSKGLVPSKEVAEQILEAGAQAKIFDKSSGAFSNVYGWRDKLVSDGCAALYLAFEIEIQKMENRSITNCLEGLDEKRSLDILGMAIDTTLLLRTIRAVTSTRPSLAGLIDRLLTPEVADRLSRTAGTLEEVSGTLFDLAAAVDMNHFSDAAKALAKVMRFSRQVMSECWNLIRASSSAHAMTALAAMATEQIDTESFFAGLDQENLSDFMRPVALDAAARVWTVNGWPALASRAAALLEEGVPKERIATIWELWCGRRTTSQVLATAADLLRAALKVNTEAFLFLTGVTLKHAIGSRSPGERGASSAAFAEIGQELQNHVVCGHHRGASEIVKWLAIQYGPEIAPGAEWILTKDGTAAFARTALECASVGELFDRLRPVCRWFRIANSSELQKLKIQSGFELVRDALGDDFSYNTADLIVGQIRAWDGNKVVIVPKWQVNLGPFSWRPRFLLPG
jgi:hypothetical protein